MAFNHCSRLSYYYFMETGNSMDIQVLKNYLTIVEEGNISHAADILHITQPTLSRQMQALEEELGAELFLRGRQIVLTDAGLLLKRRAEELVSMMIKIEDEFQEKMLYTGKISIGTGGLMGAQLLSSVITRFSQKFPQISFDFHYNSADYLKEKLDQGLLDFGLLLEPIDLNHFDFIRMPAKEKWGLLIAAQSPLASKATVSKDDLKAIPLITSHRSSVQKEFQEWFGQGVDELNIFATYNTINSAIGLIKGGNFGAVTLEGAVVDFNREQLVFKPFTPNLSMSFPNLANFRDQI